MNHLNLPDFKSYEEEAEFWDSLDTADAMPDDGQWLHFDTDHQRAVRVAILPEIAQRLMQRAQAQGVSMETLVNVLLAETVYQTAQSSRLN